MNQLIIERIKKMKHELSNRLISSFQAFLRSEEKTPSTIEKYIRDLLFFRKWTNERRIDKNNVLEYKEYLKGKYKTSSINSMLSSINSFFDFADWKDCKVKTIKMQKTCFEMKVENLLSKNTKNC